jgi:hypothetical protein
MIVVRVELWSAVNGRVTELARLAIDNQGVSDNMQRGDYRVRTYRGRDKEALDAAMLNNSITRQGKVENHKRLALHVWHLVGKALASMGYGNE